MNRISCRRLFDGEQWYSNVLLMYHHESKEIIDINENGYEEINAIPMIIPALIDLQIYGAFGRLLSEFPDSKTLENIQQYCHSGGAYYFQPTIASQSIDVILKAIDAVRSFKSTSIYGEHCIGLHLEGPWISEERRGAHDSKYVHSPSLEEVKELVNYGDGVITMITLAPEVCSEEIIRFIVQRGIIISAGHSNATYEQAIQGFALGIPTATHLFNAMSPFQHRAPGLAGAVLNHPTVKSSIVVDGYHVDYSAVQIAKKIMGERLYCITDAVTGTSTGPYQHVLSGDRYLNHGILSGSALNMLKCIQNLVNKVGIDLGEAIRMCSYYPAQVLERNEISGRISVGKRCHFIGIDDELNLISVLT